MIMSSEKHITDNTSNYQSILLVYYQNTLRRFDIICGRIMNELKYALDHLWLSRSIVSLLF